MAMANPCNLAKQALRLLFLLNDGAFAVDNLLKKELSAIVGQADFTDALIDLVSYSYDASDHEHRPAAALWPRTSEQVSRILILANRHGFAVTPRGAGTGLAGSAVPAAGGIVMDLCRMNRIIEIAVADRVVVVQPGVVYDDLQKALSPFGFFFPPDPASGRVCTLGGNVATNAGGIRGAKYGVTRDYVLRLEVVLPDGRITRTGSRCMKTASGYDLTRLFVGSEGTLGVITEITLKISPKPRAFNTALAAFKSLESGGRTVSHIMRSGVIPSVLEILDANSVRVLREHGKLQLPDAEAIILAETDGYTEEEASAQMDRIAEVFKENDAVSIERAHDSGKAEALWRVRKSVGSVAGKLRPNNVSEDVTVPISMVPDLLTGISAIVSRHGLPFVVFGHAGDGNLHPKIMYDRADPIERDHVRQAVDEVFGLACDLGGTITGEHGVGLAKSPFMAWEHDPVALNMMRSLKKLLDPNNILNPGKMDLDEGETA
jgi:glycolate oxidase